MYEQEPSTYHEHICICMYMIPTIKCWLYLIIWLVLWNMFYCSIQLGIVTPTDELIFFRGVGSNTNQLCFSCWRVFEGNQFVKLVAEWTVPLMPTGACVQPFWWRSMLSFPAINNLLVLRREWMGMGVAGIIIDSYCGSFPHSLLSTSKIIAYGKT